MKKKIFGGIAVLAIAAIAVFNVNMNINREAPLLTLANIEALAEENNGKNQGEPSERTETRTIIVKKTDESGWSWDFKLNIWKFNGSISNESPTNYWEESQAITDKYTCCLGGYSKECDHIMCPTY